MENEQCCDELAPAPASPSSFTIVKHALNERLERIVAKRAVIPAVSSIGEKANLDPVVTRSMYGKAEDGNIRGRRDFSEAGPPTTRMVR